MTIATDSATTSITDKADKDKDANFGSIYVGIGDLAIGSDHDVLLSVGLGSCVAIMLHDPIARIGGLAHIMLPSSEDFPSENTENRIMLVGEKDMLNTVKAYLAPHGYQFVGESSSMEEAITLCKTANPQIFLVHNTLGNGLEADQRLLGALQALTQPVKPIVITTSMERHRLTDYFAQGVQEVIFSPFSQDTLVNCMASISMRRLLRFANVAIPVLISKMTNYGASRQRIVAKIAGGGKMFVDTTDTKFLNVGKNNSDAVIAVLNKERIPILAMDVGGNKGRSVRLNVLDGTVSVRTKDGTKGL